MKNKRAWIRIAEASIAVLIVMSAVLILISNKKPTDISEDVYEKQSKILDIIASNQTLREQVLQGDNSQINQEILKLIPFNWGFSTNICNLDRVCPNPQNINNRQVYTTERIISSTPTNYNPKKLKFFVWMK